MSSPPTSPSQDHSPKSPPSVQISKGYRQLMSEMQSDDDSARASSLPQPTRCSGLGTNLDEEDSGRSEGDRGMRASLHPALDDSGRCSAENFIEYGSEAIYEEKTQIERQEDIVELYSEDTGTETESEDEVIASSPHQSSEIALNDSVRRSMHASVNPSLNVDERRDAVKAEPEDELVKQQQTAEDEGFSGFGSGLDNAGGQAQTPGIVVVDLDLSNKMDNECVADYELTEMVQKIPYNTTNSSVPKSSVPASELPMAAFSCNAGKQLDDTHPHTPTGAQNMCTSSKHAPQVKDAEASKLLLVTPPTSGTDPKHAIFTNTLSYQPTPFAKTLQYFKKHRRMASLPEELAAMKKEASQQAAGYDDEEETGGLNRYRDYDLGTLDPTEKGGSTAVSKSTPEVSRISDTIDNNSPKTPSIGKKVMIDKASPAQTLEYELHIPGPWSDSLNMRVQSNEPTSWVANFIRQKGEELDADEDAIKNAVDEFLSAPGTYIVAECDSVSENETKVNDESDPGTIGEESVKDADYPVFIKVVSMLPACMFWAVAKPVAYYTDRALDILTEKLTGLSVGEKA